MSEVTERMEKALKSSPDYSKYRNEISKRYSELSKKHNK